MRPFSDTICEDCGRKGELAKMLDGREVLVWAEACLGVTPAEVLDSHDAPLPRWCPYCAPDHDPESSPTDD